MTSLNVRPELHDVTLAQPDAIIAHAHKVDSFATGPQPTNSKVNSNYTSPPLQHQTESTDTTMPDTPGNPTKTTKGTMMLDRSSTMKHLENMETGQKNLNENILTLTKAITNDINDRKEDRRLNNSKESELRSIIQDISQRNANNEPSEDNNKTNECRKCDKLEDQLREIKRTIDNIQDNQRHFDQRITTNTEDITKCKPKTKENNTKDDKETKDNTDNKTQTEPWKVVASKRNKYTPAIDLNDKEEVIENSKEEAKEEYLSYAKVTTNTQKVPKIKLTETIKEKSAKNTEEERSKQNQDNKYKPTDNDENDDDKRKDVINKTSNYAKRVVGIKPISRKQVAKKVEKLKRQGLIQETDTDDFNFATAAKTEFKDFLNRNLGMNREQIKEIKVKKLFFSTNTDVEILYVECLEQEDISKIYTHANKLPKGDKKDRPQLINYVPTSFNDRHRDVQNLAFNLRKKYNNQVVTNIRLGKYDYILRLKQKGDSRKWSEIPQVEFPETLRPFQVGHTKILNPIEFNFIKPTNNPEDIEMEDQSEKEMNAETIREARENDKENQLQNETCKKLKLQTPLDIELEKIQETLPNIPQSIQEPTIDEILNPGISQKNQKLSFKSLNPMPLIKRQISKEKNNTNQIKSYEGQTQ